MPRAFRGTKKFQKNFKKNPNRHADAETVSFLRASSAMVRVGKRSVTTTSGEAKHAAQANQPQGMTGPDGNARRRCLFRDAVIRLMVAARRW
jgi:hypothetical protein